MSEMLQKYSMVFIWSFGFMRERERERERERVRVRKNCFVILLHYVGSFKTFSKKNVDYQETTKKL